LWQSKNAAGNLFRIASMPGADSGRFRVYVKLGEIAKEKHTNDEFEPDMPIAMHGAHKKAHRRRMTVC